MESVLVTADRAETKASQTTSSVSVLGAQELSQIPGISSSDILRFVPGFFVFDRDGLGRDAIVSTRGFYGGGEAEYIHVLVNGNPINDLETGLVDWNLVPRSSISAIEVVRGSSSPLYGDAALGGVINIRTQDEGMSTTKAFVQGGSFRDLDYGITHREMSAGMPFELSLTSEQTSGFRDHARWQATTLSGNTQASLFEKSILRISVLGQWTKSDDSGPLTQEEVSTNRSGSSSYYKADGKDDRRYQIQSEYSYRFSESSEITSNFYYNRKDANDIRTFVTPSEIVRFFPSVAVIGVFDTSLYGDTKDRELHSNEVGADFKYNVINEIGSMRNRIVAGFDGVYGHLHSTYYRQFAGFETDYDGTDFSRGAMLVDGIGSRTKYAFYISDELRLSAPLAVTLGVRFDGISDQYNGNQPDTAINADRSALSPKFGINYRFAGGESFAGNLYMTVNNSFKVATFDQFSDQRPVDAALFSKDNAGNYHFMPSQYSSFSNSLLMPQKGTSYELGTYQQFKFFDELISEVVLSVYRMDMTDEIDFDLSTLKYQNIQNSRHLGVELGLRASWLPHVSGFANYTVSDVRFRSGPNDGHYLKAIPRNIVTLGATFEAVSCIHATLAWNFVNDMFLDDENTLILPNYNIGSMRLSYDISRVITSSLVIENLLDREYSSTGYLLYGKRFLYPAAGRLLHIGIDICL